MIQHIIYKIKSIIEILLLVNYYIITLFTLIDANILYTNKKKAGTSGPFAEKETFNLTINRDTGFAVE